MSQTTHNNLNEKALKEEWEIVSSAQKDPIHFKKLYEAHYRSIFLFVYHKIGNKELTADLVSQVFSKALFHLPTFKNQGVPFSAWLYRIATNEVMRHFRHSNKVRYVPIDNTMLENMLEETQQVDVEDIYLWLEEAMQELRLEDVHLLELRFEENMSYKEIAYILQMSETNAKTKIWRILEKIRKKSRAHYG